jgi:hypothetical protein
VGERPRTNLKLRCVRTRVSCAIFRSSEDRVRSSAESRAASAPRHIVFLRSSQLPYAASTNRVLAEPTLRLRKMLLKAAQWAQLGCVQENLDAAATGGAAANTIRLPSSSTAQQLCIIVHIVHDDAEDSLRLCVAVAERTPPQLLTWTQRSFAWVCCRHGLVKMTLDPP